MKPFRGDMSIGWRGVSLSDALGCDFRAVRASAYMVICVDDWTGSKWDVRMDGARAAMPSSWNRTMMPGRAMRSAGWSRRGSSLPVDAVGECRKRQGQAVAFVILTHGAGCRGVLWGRRFGSCMAVPESDAESSRKVLFQGWNLKNSMKIGKVGAAKP